MNTSNVLELVIDIRERELIEKLNARIDYKVEQLDIGDILIRDKEGEIVFIIERKTIADLKASICDGRSREQKARLLGTVPCCRIMYLIEGSLNKSLNSQVSGVPISTLIGSLINTQLRDGIRVYKTASIDETTEFIVKLVDKLEKDGNMYFKETTNGDESTASTYSATLKKQKKANMTPQVWFIAQLSLIPQVTEKVAEVIMEKYPSVQELVCAYEKTPVPLREKLLADIVFPLKNGKTRRVGDKMSTRIYQFFYNSVA